MKYLKFSFSNENNLALFIGISLIMFLNLMSMSAFAHETGERHPKSLMERLIERSGSEAAAQRIINNMKPSARNRFLAKDRAHPRITEARSRAKSRIRDERNRKRTAFNTMKNITLDRSQGCINCHALPTSLSSGNATTADMAQVARVVSGHRATAWPAPGRDTCSDCHVAGWHAPASNMRFRSNMSNYQLCLMLNTPTSSHPTVRGHLLNDPLIRWAVNGTAHPRNPPGNRPNRRNKGSEWRAAVNTWTALTNGWNTPEQKCNIFNPAHG